MVIGAKMRRKYFCLFFIIILPLLLNPISLSFYKEPKNPIIIRSDYQSYLREMYLQNLLFEDEIGFGITHDSMLYILNFSKPPIGKIISNLQLTQAIYSDMVLLDGYLYLARGSKGFQIIDVTDLTSPSSIYVFEPLSIQIGSIGLIDNFIIVPRYILQTVEVYDISDPSSPSLANSIEVLGIGSINYDIFYSQDTLQMAIDNEIVIIDFTSINTYYGDGIRIGFYLENIHTSLRSLISFQDYTLVFTSQLGISNTSYRKGGIIRYDPMEEPYPLFSNVTFFDGDFREVEFVNGLHFIADYLYGLKILEINSVEEINEVGHYTCQNIQELAILGNYVYLMAHYTGETTIVDISNASNPVVYNPATYNITNESFFIKDYYFIALPNAFLLALIIKKVKKKKSQLV